MPLRLPNAISIVLLRGCLIGDTRSDPMIVFRVYNSEEFVGEFLQAIFTTNEKAEDYIDRRGIAGDNTDNMYIEGYTLDSE